MFGGAADYACAWRDVAESGLNKTVLIHINLASRVSLAQGRGELVGGGDVQKRKGHALTVTARCAVDLSKLDPPV